MMLFITLQIAESTAAIIAAAIGAAGAGATAGASAASSKKQREWSQWQNDLNREFQANQSSLAREWARDFYEQYQTPSAQVRQYEEAGLNPALMYDNGVNAASASSVPISSSPNANLGYTNAQQGFTSALATLANVAGVATQIARVPAQNARDESAAEESRASAHEKESHVLLNQGLVKYYDVLSDKTEVESRLAEANISLTEAKTNWTLADTLIKNIDSKYRDALNSAEIELKKAQSGLADAESHNQESQAQFYKEKLSEVRSTVVKNIAEAITELHRQGNLDASTEKMLAEADLVRTDKALADVELKYKPWEKIASNLLTSFKCLTEFETAGKIRSDKMLGLFKSLAGLFTSSPAPIGF